MGSSVRVAIILLAIGLTCHCSDNPTKPNRRPLLASVGPQSVLEGARLEFLVQATDPDGTIPALSARNIPTHASAVDSGNGRMLFVFEPDLTQSGAYDVTFIASDGQLTSRQVVTIVVTPNLPAHAWPMAVGNCWVFEVRHSSGSDTGNFHTQSWQDSICVLSSYQRDGAVHWRLRSGLRFVGGDVAFRNDSIVGTSHSVRIPSTWPDRADSVPAGLFLQTYYDRTFMRPGIEPSEEGLTFARNVGVIRYGWFNGLAMHPEWYNAVLISYQIKQ